MTFIQPTKSGSILNLILGGLCVAVVAGVFGMVVLYNQTVNLNHNITSAKAELDAIGSQTTALNNQVIATLGSGNALASIVSADGLVQDQTPKYFETQQQWPIASQQ